MTKSVCDHCEDVIVEATAVRFEDAGQAFCSNECHINHDRDTSETASDPWMKHPLARMSNDSAEDRERSEA